MYLAVQDHGLDDALEGVSAADGRVARLVFKLTTQPRFIC